MVTCILSTPVTLPADCIIMLHTFNLILQMLLSLSHMHCCTCRCPYWHMSAHQPFVVWNWSC